MMFSRENPQLLGMLGALLFGGQAVQAIDLDLTNTGMELSLLSWVAILGLS